MNNLNIPVFQLHEFKVRQDQSLPQGTFGIVWDAWHGRLNRVAVKVMRYNVKLEEFEKEVKVMLKASTEFCCVPTFGMISQNIHNNRPCYAIVSKFMPCGTLDNLLHKYQIHLPQCLSYRMLLDISDAMNKLHTIYPDQRLLHCDLKPSNILIDENFHAKIADFGASRFSTLTQDRHLEGPDPSSVHTINYCAPEFFQGLARSSKSDVFSFATMVWEVLTTRVPFQGCTHTEIKALVLMDTPMVMAGIVDQRIQGLITNGRSKEENNRPAFADIKESLNELLQGTSNAEMDEAVSNAKQSLLEKLGKSSFDTSSADYSITLADALRNNNLIGPVPIPEGQGNGQMIASPMGDEASSSNIEGDQVLTDEHCVKLGSDLHYMDGWEVLASRLGLASNIIENITQDHRKKNVQRKIAMFREWKRLNGGPAALKLRLAKSLKQQNVSVDVWEFLVPNQQARRDL